MGQQVKTRLTNLVFFYLIPLKPFAVKGFSVFYIIIISEFLCPLLFMLYFTLIFSETRYSKEFPRKSDSESALTQSPTFKSNLTGLEPL